MSQPTSQPAGREILVVDDDRDVLRSLVRTISSFGLNVASTSNPRKALEMVIAESDRFAAIITDIDMPELSGDELLERIAAAGIAIPAIKISGRFETSRPEEHSLAKPCDRREIRAALIAIGVISAPSPTE